MKWIALTVAVLAVVITAWVAWGSSQPVGFPWMPG